MNCTLIDYVMEPGRNDRILSRKEWIDLHDLAWGPMRVVQTWPICDVNGYRFHTNSWSEGRKTDNSGVSVKGTAESIDETIYYGILQEIIQLEYPG